jgi:hypothetical protein
MKLPKQSRPAIRNQYCSRGTGTIERTGINMQGLLPPFACHALCAAGLAACMASGVPAPVCTAAAAACNSAC